MKVRVRLVDVWKKVGSVVACCGKETNRLA